MSKIAFVFPGQGSQTVGMCKDLYDNYTCARKVFEAADEALGFSISDMCFNGPEDQLRLTFNTQPAILTASVACAEVLKENGLNCEVAAGHSLGEYSALVLAGALDFADAVRIVRKRGQFMQEAVPVGEGSMAAVLGLESDKIVDICRTVEAECGEAVQAVNFNCPGQVVIAGAVGAVDKALAALKEAGAKRAVLLPVSAPFHSTLMQPASKRLAEVFETVAFHDAKIPVVALTFSRAITLLPIAACSHKITAKQPGIPKNPAISALTTVILRPKPKKPPIRLINHKATAPQIPFQMSRNGSEKHLTTMTRISTPIINGSVPSKVPELSPLTAWSMPCMAEPPRSRTALSISCMLQFLLSYILCLFSKARDKVSSSAYSRSPPTGRPWAMRLITIPIGFSSCAR